MKEKKLKKPTKLQVWRFIKYCLIVVLGNAVAAAASGFFIVPNGFVMGGTTGLGIFVRNLINNSGATMKIDPETIVTIVVYAANIALFILGAVLLGKKFAAATAAGTLLYPTFLRLWGFVNEAMHNPFHFENEPLLAVIFGAFLFGLGIGIVVRVGASTGGTDIPPMILHKFFNFPVSAGMWILDISIVLLQFAAKKSPADILYGILIVLLSSLIVDKVSVVGVHRAQVKIVSKKYEDIRKMILNKLNLGVTMLYGKTGFLREDCYVIMTVVSNRDVVRLRNAVQAVDADALFMVSTISEVRGRGFSSERVALPKTEEGENLKVVSVEMPDGAVQEQSEDKKHEVIQPETVQTPVTNEVQTEMQAEVKTEENKE